MDARDGESGPPSTRFLYRQAQAGRREAMEQLLQRLRPRLTKWVASRHTPALRARYQVEDLVQEILIKAYSAIPSFKAGDRRAVRSWLFTVAENTLRDAYKRVQAARRDPKREVPVHSRIAGASTTPSQGVSRDEERDRFLRVLAKLPEAHREIIRLRLYEHLSTEEVAARLGISPKNVAVRLVRAKKALQAKFLASHGPS